MNHSLFSMIDWSTMTDGWVQQWLPNLAGVGSSTIVALLITYAFAWHFVMKAKERGFDRVYLPFMKLESNQDVEQIITMANTDTVLIESLDATRQTLELETHERMMRVLNRTAVRYIQKYGPLDKGDASPEQPPNGASYTDYIQKTKLSLMFVISQNHIIQLLARHGIEPYIEDKQIQIVNTVSAGAENRPEIVRMVEKMVKEFIVQIVPIQRALCENKIDSYRAAIVRMQMDGNKARCQAKIERNERYLEAIAGIEKLLADVSATIANGDMQRIAIDGGKIMNQEVEKMDRLVTHMSNSGQIGLSSSLLPAEVRKGKK